MTLLCLLLGVPMGPPSAVPYVVDAGPLTKITLRLRWWRGELDPSYDLSFHFDPLVSSDLGSQLALQSLDVLQVVMKAQSRWLPWKLALTEYWITSTGDGDEMESSGRGSSKESASIPAIKYNHRT
jgi:hypothetical protein